MKSQNRVKPSRMLFSLKESMHSIYTHLTARIGLLGHTDNNKRTIRAH